MIASAENLLASLPLWLLLVVVLVGPALEASTFLGIVVPAETVVFLGGVTAAVGHHSLPLVVLAGAVGAVVGDQVGYHLGRRLGPTMLGHAPARLRRRGTLDRALLLVRRHGVLTVFLARWAASLRAVVPTVAGVSGLSAGRFTLGNTLGAVTWVAVVAYLGHVAGAHYRTLLDRVGIAGLLLLVACLVALWWYVRVGRSVSARPEPGIGS
jgi:undecaprenyl-diphosphatase